MLFYDLELDVKKVLEDVKDPDEFYTLLVEQVPKNIDKRIFNNTTFYYFSVACSNLSREVASNWITVFMQKYLGELVGDLQLPITLQHFVGGQRFERRKNNKHANSRKNSGGLK